jgi:hypothetical protein
MMHKLSSYYCLDSLQRVNYLDLYCVLFLLKKTGQVPVAHTCNPSYTEGRDQKDHGS